MASLAPEKLNSPAQRNGKPTERWRRKALGSKAEYLSYHSLLPKREGMCLISNRVATYCSRFFLFIIPGRRVQDREP